jgi:hypothetical protein
MGIGEILPSVHKHRGWEGQYYRMLRWHEKFKKTNPGNFEDPQIDEQHDIMYACFQNIFYMKDWLHHSAGISKDILHRFLEGNLQLQACRDICNGTKHFSLRNASVDDDFTIIREYNPLHKVFGQDQYHLVMLGGGRQLKLKELASDCVALWSRFIEDHNLK